MPTAGTLAAPGSLGRRVDADRRPPVLVAALLRFVVGDRSDVSQPDGVDPGHADALLDQEPADRLGAPLAEPDVIGRGADAVGEAFELHGQLRLLLQLLDEREE